MTESDSIPESEIQAYEEIVEDYEADLDEECQSSTILLYALIDLLIDVELIEPDELMKALVRTIHETDQTQASVRDELRAKIRELCPALSKHLDEDDKDNP